MKICTFDIFLYWIFVQLVCVKSQCEEILDQSVCNSNDLCEWNYWKPSLCQNICSSLINESTCNLAVNCQWSENSSSCFIKKCTDEKNKDKCAQIVACFWSKDVCWDSSCVQLQAEQAGKCPIAYCIWNEKRKLCYDKKCSDYYNQYDCSQMSFCSWYKYKCLDNGNKKLDF